MKIPEKNKIEWDTLRTHGDFTQISERTDGKVSVKDISMAFTTGRCSVEVFTAIAEFYKERSELLSDYLTVAK